ncbi:MAG: DUF3788 domain-containing protein [Firmicutes bacterium]|nr:DUF3788 domain-containing protein [Bacillota bacterium]
MATSIFDAPEKVIFINDECTPKKPANSNGGSGQSPFFNDKAIEPNDAMVEMALGSVMPLWNKLQSHVAENYSGLVSEWKMYSKKAGWSLVFKLAKRTLFYFVPCENHFIIAFVLGEKAVKTALESSISQKVRQEMSDADICVMGHSFFVYIKSEKDLGDVKTLLKIKEGAV